MPSVEPPRGLCVSLHDVAPATWPECARLLAMLDALGPIPITLLVVPDYHRRGRIQDDPAFLRALEKRLARGDEIALHGYYHVDDATPAAGPRAWFQRRIYTAREGEFAALASQEARGRLERGLEAMQRLGWPVYGFVAPAWLLGRAARQALGALPFLYTTTLRNVYRLPDWHRTSAQSLVYSVRAPWRRALSRAWNTMLFERLKDRRLLRLSLHPADVHHENVLAHWRHFVGRALADRQPVTKHTWMEASTCADP